MKNLKIPGVVPPSRTCNDPKCPYHGSLSVRGAFLEGIVVSRNMQKNVTVKHEYLHYVKKYKRFEKRSKKIHAYLPPCIDVNIGDKVIIGQCRPISKTVSFVVLGKKAEVK